MNRLFQMMVAAAVLSVALPGTAVGEDVPDAERVVLVDFDTHDVEPDVMDQFYKSLRNILADAESMGLEEHGEFSMDDLWLMAGCSSTDPECLSFLSDFVDGDQLLFGSVEQSDGEYSFSLTLFDFESQENVRKVTEKSLRDDDRLAEGIPAIIESFIFGETSAVAVEVVGAPDAEITVDGEPVGTGSADVDGLAPGEVIVAAQESDETLEEELILRHEETAQVQFEFEFEPAIADIDDVDSEQPSLIPGLAATGVGVLGLGLGLVGQTQLSSARSEAEDRVSGGVFDGDPARAKDLQSDMDSANTLRYVGFTGGVVGLAAGGALLFRAMTAEPTDDGELATDRAFDLDVGATSEGVNAGFRLDF